MKILILGVKGMLGHTLFYYFSKIKNYAVYATERGTKDLNRFFPEMMLQKVIYNVNADDIQTVQKTVKMIKPDVVINCIGIIKQLKEAKDPIISIKINSIFPHQLAEICTKYNYRMIHLSTDCIFSGKQGYYKEEDVADANDLYGRTKYLGEVDYPNSITLRTSIIGHELSTKYGLVEWFLSQNDKVIGFTRAYFSGFPTIEIANILHKFIIPNEHISGVYNVSSNKISKYDLLRLIAVRYGKNIKIEADNNIEIDRSLDSKKFKEITGYKPPEWRELIDKMYLHQNEKE